MLLMDFRKLSHTLPTLAVEDDFVSSDWYGLTDICQVNWGEDDHDKMLGQL